MTLQRSRQNITLLLLGGALLALAACTAVAPVRTLPEHIKRVCVPEFRNLSRLYAAQADLTLYVQDHILYDGRLDLVECPRADVRLEGRIKDFREYTIASSSDRFPLVSAMEMQCVVDLWDPYDTDRIAPIARYAVPAAIQFVSDPRRAIEETRTEARERLLQQMAKNIVDTVIQGAPLPPTPLEQRAVLRYQERHAKQQYIPPASLEPRFPQPTPLPRMDVPGEEDEEEEL